jgi:hypothetical protein
MAKSRPRKNAEPNEKTDTETVVPENPAKDALRAGFIRFIADFIKVPTIVGGDTSFRDPRLDDLECGISSRSWNYCLAILYPRPFFRGTAQLIKLFLITLFHTFRVHFVPAYQEFLDKAEVDNG